MRYRRLTVNKCRFRLASINAQTHVGPMYKDLMKGLMRRKIPVQELIDEWRTEGIKEAEEFGEGWVPEDLDQESK